MNTRANTILRVKRRRQSVDVYSSGGDNDIKYSNVSASTSSLVIKGVNPEFLLVPTLGSKKHKMGGLDEGKSQKTSASGVLFRKFNPEDDPGFITSTGPTIKVIDLEEEPSVVALPPAIHSSDPFKRKKLKISNSMIGDKSTRASYEYDYYTLATESSVAANQKSQSRIPRMDFSFSNDYANSSPSAENIYVVDQLDSNLFDFGNDVLEYSLYADGDLIAEKDDSDEEMLDNPDDEDSNAEDYFKNDYPDDEEAASMDDIEDCENGKCALDKGFNFNHRSDLEDDYESYDD